MEYHVQILIVMIAYMTLLILWGLYQGRKVKTDADYAIAGRRLNRRYHHHGGRPAGERRDGTAERRGQPDDEYGR